MSLDKQHVMGAAAEASEPALVASLPEPVPVSASGDGQAQGGPSRELIRACIQWAFDSVGEGFAVPEDAFWAYSKATGDEDWDTLPDRLSDAGDTALEASSRQEERMREAVKALLPIGDPKAPDSRVIPIYVRMSELRALHELAAPHVKEQADAE